MLGDIFFLPLFTFWHLPILGFKCHFPFLSPTLHSNSTRHSQKVYSIIEKVLGYSVHLFLCGVIFPSVLFTDHFIIPYFFLGGGAVICVHSMLFLLSI